MRVTQPDISLGLIRSDFAACLAVVLITEVLQSRAGSGSEPGPVRPPQTAKEVKNLLAEAMAGIHAGRIEPKIASIMAYVGTALLKAFETTDLEERIEALEQPSQKD
jgi:hypothetical protein